MTTIIIFTIDIDHLIQSAKVFTCFGNKTVTSRTSKFNDLPLANVLMDIGPDVNAQVVFQLSSSKTESDVDSPKSDHVPNDQG